MLKVIDQSIADATKIVEKGISESWISYGENGSRSTAKLIPLHSAYGRAYLFLAKCFSENPHNFTFRSAGENNGKEYKAKTQLGTKNIDLTLFYKMEPILFLQVKFPSTNYKQNSNNYLEGGAGEIAFLRGVPENENIVLQNIYVLPVHLPYMDSSKNLKHIESLNEPMLLKHKAFSELLGTSKPDSYGLSLIDTKMKNHFIIGKRVDWSKSIDITFPRSREEYLSSHPLLSVSGDTIDFLDKASNIGQVLFDAFVMACQQNSISLNLT